MQALSHSTRRLRRETFQFARLELRSRHIVNGGGGDDLIFGDFAIREVGENGVNYNDPGFIQGDDILNGGGGDDAIYGHGGDCVLDGGAGADTLVGGMGADIIIGGGGDDQFVYNRLASRNL